MGVPAIPNLIPVLNMISEYLMSQTADPLPNALVQSVDPHVVVQKRMRNLNVEWIVWGHLWGSLAASYEKGVTGHSVGRTCPMDFIGFKSLMCHSSRQRQKLTLDTRRT